MITVRADRLWRPTAELLELVTGIVAGLKPPENAEVSFALMQVSPDFPLHVTLWCNGKPVRASIIPYAELAADDRERILRARTAELLEGLPGRSE
jgi:hypothetical protein